MQEFPTRAAAGLWWGEPRWLTVGYHPLQFTLMSGKLAGAQHLRQPVFLLDLDVSQRGSPKGL